MDSNSWLSATGYEMAARIGNGAFSSVYRAKRKDSSSGGGGGHHYVAIKIMDLEHISSSFEDILQEVQTMKMCDDPNILRCHCSFVNADQLWLVTELMDKGSCLRVMNAARSLGMGDGMNEEWLAYILREALQGLHYLHNNGQIHRDIKSGNILLDGAGSVRLADFGVSGWTVNSGQRLKTVKTFVGTPVYMAPEVMEQAGGYDYRADVWSLGITALELAKGVAPYAQYSAMKVLVLTIEEDPPSLRTYPTGDRQRTGAPFSKSFEEFYVKCLQKNPRLRPSTEELLKHRFFKNRSCYALVDQLLNSIPSVGGAGAGAASGAAGGAGGAAGALDVRARLPGEAPVAIQLELAATVHAADLAEQGGANVIPAATAAPAAVAWAGAGPGAVGEGEGSDHPPPAPKQYVAGTTWVFDDDSVHGSGSVSHRGSGARLRLSSAFGPGRRSGGGGGGSGDVGGLLSPGVAGAAACASTPGGDIDAFLNDFEENAASMTVAPPRAALLSSRGDDAGGRATPAAASQVHATAPATASDGIAAAAKTAAKAVDETGTDAFMDELEDLIR